MYHATWALYQVVDLSSIVGIWLIILEHPLGPHIKGLASACVVSSDIHDRKSDTCTAAVLASAGRVA